MSNPSPPPVGSTVGVVDKVWFRLDHHQWRWCQLDPAASPLYSTWGELVASGDTITVIHDSGKPRKKGHSEVATPEKAPAKGGTPPTSPWLAYTATDFAGFTVSFTVTFDASNNLTGATVFRDAACQYKNVYIGLGVDGTPNTTSKKFAIPAGTTQVSKAQINAVGVRTVADAQDTQITAGP